ncbi:pyridoxamine 5'-phosphate oxidase family protein [Undibacterium sp.]|uniref:pyridoxamine 5'-phosphate oxidase family protein n=1 Tax=Undibacterium sp. TaxID=1914977 RepID=UPI00374CCFAC
MNTAFEFHAGERLIQSLAGESAVAERNGTMIANMVIAGARGFIEKQFMVLLGSVDAHGRPWASVIYGTPGFSRTLDGTSILMDAPAAARDPLDPVWSNIAVGSAIGMLFIELSTRRRYRINGSVKKMNDRGLVVDIDEAYPNCPKYIQRRQLSALEAAGDALSNVTNNVINNVVTEAGASVQRGNVLSEDARRLLQQADTLFVASAHPQHGADISHRGGNPGFIQVLDNGTLRIPDYHGNSMFNTLGNMQAYPLSGLLVQDFSHNRVLQLTGEATVRWDIEDAGGATGGTGRYWDFQIKEWILRPVPQRLEWQYVDASPFNPITGGSEEVLP